MAAFREPAKRVNGRAACYKGDGESDRPEKAAAKRDAIQGKPAIASSYIDFDQHRHQNRIESTEKYVDEKRNKQEGQQVGIESGPRSEKQSNQRGFSGAGYPGKNRRKAYRSRGTKEGRIRRFRFRRRSAQAANGRGRSAHAVFRCSIPPRRPVWET